MTQRVHAAAVAVKVKLAEEFVTEVGTCTHSNRVQFISLAVLLEAACKSTAVLLFSFFFFSFFPLYFWLRGTRALEHPTAIAAKVYTFATATRKLFSVSGSCSVKQHDTSNSRVVQALRRHA